jgi:hypothetical protein
MNKLPRLQIDNSNTVIAKFCDEQPLVSQVDCEMVNASCHRPEDDLGLKTQGLCRPRRRDAGAECKKTSRSPPSKNRFHHWLLSAMFHADIVVDLTRGLGMSLHASLVKLTALLAAIRRERRPKREQIAKQSNCRGFH